MDADGDMTLLVVGMVAYVVAVVAIVGGFLMADWRAGRRRVREARRELVKAGATSRELVRVGYRVRANYHRYR